MKFYTFINHIYYATIFLDDEGSCYLRMNDDHTGMDIVNYNVILDRKDLIPFDMNSYIQGCKTEMSDYKRLAISFILRETIWNGIDV